jgi:hypothetical protein
VTTHREPVAEELRIGADDVKARLESGKPITILDVRNDKAWDASPIKIHGAIRILAADFAIDPSWPKGQPAVVY